MSSVITVKPRVRKRRALQYTGSPDSRNGVVEFTQGKVMEHGSFGHFRIMLPGGHTLSVYPNDWILESHGVGPSFFTQSDTVFQKSFKAVAP